jgi:hypothetical protein
MPAQKNFKRLVRARMSRTGESYSTARSRFEPPPAPAPQIDADPDSAALARALAAAGYTDPTTDSLLFGIGGGIGFLYLVFVYPGWTSVAADGRFNALYFEKHGFIEVACARLGVPLRVRQTSDAQSTERLLRKALTQVAEVAVTVDLTRLPAGGPTPPELPYCPYVVTVAEADGDLAIHGLPRGRITMPWHELVEARWTNAKKYGGLYLIGPPAGELDIRTAVLAGIDRTAQCLVQPDRSSFDSSFGVPGIRRWARLLTDSRDKRGWPRLFAEPEARSAALASVVRGLGGRGTSGSACRRPYAQFLADAAVLLGAPALAEAAKIYRELGERWAALVALAGQPGITPADLAAPLPDLADAEEHAARLLQSSIASLVEGPAR